MKNKTIVFFAGLLLTLTLLSCGSSKFSNNSALKDFLNRFDKEEFLTQVETEREMYEVIVRKLKKANSTDAAIREKYTDTQRAYNQVLDNMIADIKATQNIVSYKLFDANSKYNERLYKARQTGEYFMEAARLELQDETLTVTPIVSFVVVQLWPFIQKVQNKYLDYCKLHMESRVNQSKLRFWSDVL